MTTNLPFVIIATISLLALSAFFVAVEFALIGARRHRLEEAATSSRSARAALRSSSELTVLLAGSQLGITICTLALGAISKPAVHYWITPRLADWGMPKFGADALGFVLALIAVTFLHLVVGEMAPKSWAIAHPERSATLLALPMRGFMWLTRPAIVSLNNMANWCLRRVGVDPDAEAAGQTAEDLRHLVEHSADVGALEAHYSAQLAGALDLHAAKVADLVVRRPLSAVPSSGTVADLQHVSADTGHLRVLIKNGQGRPEGVVHLRDTLTLPTQARLDEIEGLTRPLFVIDADEPVHAALARMRETRNHLALVTTGANGSVVGVMTLADILPRLFPEAEPNAPAADTEVEPTS